MFFHGAVKSCLKLFGNNITAGKAHHKILCALVFEVAGFDHFLIHLRNAENFGNVVFSDKLICLNGVEFRNNDRLKGVAQSIMHRSDKTVCMEAGKNAKTVCGLIIVRLVKEIEAVCHIVESVVVVDNRLAFARGSAAVEIEGVSSAGMVNAVNVRMLFGKHILESADCIKLRHFGVLHLIVYGILICYAVTVIRGRANDCRVLGKNRSERSGKKIENKKTLGFCQLKIFFKSRRRCQRVNKAYDDAELVKRIKGCKGMSAGRKKDRVNVAFFQSD